MPRRLPPKISRRLGIILFLLSGPVAAQEPQPPYIQIVESRLKDASVLSRWLNDSAPDRTNAMQKLTASLSDNVRQSAPWQEVNTAQQKIDPAIQDLLKLLNAGIAADRTYPDHPTDPPANNLASALDLQRAMERTISNIVALMEQQATGAKRLPRDARTRFGEARLDETVDTLENADRACRNRIAAYEQMLHDLKP